MATGLSGLEEISGSDSHKTGTVASANGEVAHASTGAIDNQYFFEDEIFRIDHKGRLKLGLVIETAEMYSGDEDDVFDDVLNKSEVRVAWYPEGKEDVQLERAIGLADRTLMPGDVVRRLVTGTDDTQRGYCREISMRADVKVLGTKYVIQNVLAERLRLIGRWQRDSAVCLDSWVGSTKDIEEKAVLRSVNGSRIEVTSNNFYIFKEVHARSANSVFNRQIFYPGNVVVGRLPSMENVTLLSPKVPLPTNKKGKPLMSRYTIESVYTDAVWVHWQCKALSEEANIESSALQQPSPCVTGEDLKRLKRLNLFESCMLQINDRNYLKYSQFDTLIKKSEWDKEQAIKFKLILSEQQKQENQNLFVHTGGGSTNTSHHFDKLKKKLTLLDTDKLGKSKKFALKVDKLGNSSNKEKSQNHEPKKSEAGWISEGDDEDDDDDDNDEYFGALAEDGISTATTMSTCSSPSPRGSPKHLNRRHLRKKATKNLKKPIKTPDVAPLPEFTPKDGDDLVTEALLVYSKATVIWQDGTIERDIPSTQLYPIHHLDNHEFFPGDFVISGTEDSDVSFRDYGVIQTVDHHGRTAHVKWFTTYTSADEPKPTHKGESEVSVYDLKDHPDFQYRPGTMVIRVANFVGADATCTAGQIIDNFIDGRVKVWWVDVDGHISMCWPQDLFEVGQYDHADWGHESEDSWETESEHSEYGDNNSPKLSIGESHILANIDRARVAIARLEEIFHISPNLQNPEVMRKLLTVYKGCRYLDRLLNTCFFHEDNFMGLIERVRKVGSQTISERAQDRKNRLFSDGGQATSPNVKLPQHHHHQPHQQQQCHFQAIVAVNSTQKLQTANHPSAKEYAPKVLFNISSTPFKCSHNCNSSMAASGGAGCAANSSNNGPTAYKRKCSPVAAARCDNANDKANVETPTSLYNLVTTQSAGATSRSHSPKKTPASPCIEASPGKSTPYNAAEKNQLLTSAKLNIEKSSSENDSGNSSRNENCDGSSTSNTSSSDLTHIEANSSLTKANDDQKSISSVSIIELPVDSPPELVCVRMCTAPSPGKNNSYSAEKNLLLCSAMLNIEKAYEKTSHIKTTKTAASSQDDSGNYSRNENCGGSSTSYASSSDLTNIEANSSLTKANDDQKSISCSSIELTEDAPPELVCVRLCALLKDQLIKCFTEIREKYCKEDNLNLSDVLDLDAGDDEYLETILEINDVTENANPEEEATAPPSPKTPVAIEEPPTVVSSPLKQVSPTTATASVPSECFQVLSNAPKAHKFHLTIFHPNNAQQYYRAIHREHRMLKSCLPPGVWIKVFEDRMDLLSVMIEGPKNTPYEDGMFFFDIQLGREYPKSPPLCHYISYCSDRLNPNLYEDGKVCVSLLGTWSGRDSEVWSANSTLLQVIVSIQGLILVSEPYFNEAGYEKQKGSQQGKENSRMYNEMVIIKMVLATAKLLQQPPEMFRQEIVDHFKLNGHSMYERIKGWMELSKLPNGDKVETGAEPQPSEANAAKQSSYTLPDFPLVPASRGFCLTLAGLLETFKSKIDHLAGVSDDLAPAAK